MKFEESEKGRLCEKKRSIFEKIDFVTIQATKIVCTTVRSMDICAFHHMRLARVNNAWL